MPELKKTPGKCSQSQHGCSERSGWRPVSVRYSGMLNHTKPLLFGLTLLFSGLTSAQISNSSAGTTRYTNDGQMKFPEDYRQWVYLTTGFDMSYNPALQMDHHMFDNVFVNPEAYKVFMATGKWPDKTTFVLEARRAMDKGSINQRGNYQGSDVMGLEVHVKDETRFPGKWAFFAFGNAKTATITPATAECYSCHAMHGAVDTTFVQFYPTLLPIANSKGTLAPGYSAR